jgi:hypothetical protein
VVALNQFYRTPVMPSRRFPPPWSVENNQLAWCFLFILRLDFGSSSHLFIMRRASNSASSRVPMILFPETSTPSSG